MRLADFIDHNTAKIVDQWEAFAVTLFRSGSNPTRETLRDHAEQILQAMADDLRSPQTPAQQLEKSEGREPRQPGAPRTAAQTHAVLRAGNGFTIQQMVAEYRALRATVLRLWFESDPPTAHSLDDMRRFNEALDQAIAESVDFFSAEVDRWRSIFLGVLGHDLRGPLNAILLTSRLIPKLGDGASIGDATARLMRNGERMKELLDDLLDYSKTTLNMGIPVSRSTIDLRRPCEEELELMRAALPGLELQLVSDGDTVGRFDASRVRQVLGNLLSNAASYGDPKAPVVARLVGNSEMVRLSVENSGVTIPAERLQLLFEPLRRIGAEQNNHHTHLGLGLFIVRQIALAHDGAVSAVSCDGRTVFTVDLPK